MPLVGAHWDGGNLRSWQSLATEMVDAAVDSSDGWARMLDEAHPSEHGRAVDRLEALARVGLIASFAWRRADDQTRARWSRFLSQESMRAITQLPSPIPDMSQLILEAASLKISDVLTNGEIFGGARDRIMKWANSGCDRRTPQNNWVLISAILGEEGPAASHRVAYALREIDSWYVGNGWYSDGADNSFDYYNSWAFHYYPFLFAALGLNDLSRERIARANAYVASMRVLIADDGEPLRFGRSLTYRFGAVAAASALALSRPGSASNAELGALASRTIEWFVRSGAFSPDGLLRRGWTTGKSVPIQPYSGPGASYWAGKVFISLLLEDSDPFWAPAPMKPLTSPYVLPGPGLIGWRDASGNANLVNHGSSSRRMFRRPEAQPDPGYSPFFFSTSGEAGDTRGPAGILRATAGPIRLERGVVVQHGTRSGWICSVGDWRSSPLSITRAAIPPRLVNRFVSRWQSHAASVVVGGWVIHVFWWRRLPVRVRGVFDPSVFDKILLGSCSRVAQPAVIRPISVGAGTSAIAVASRSRGTDSICPSLAIRKVAGAIELTFNEDISGVGPLRLS